MGLAQGGCVSQHRVRRVGAAAEDGRGLQGQSISILGYRDALYALGPAFVLAVSRSHCRP
jgi:hypothetical protein